MTGSLHDRRDAGGTAPQPEPGILRPLAIYVHWPFCVSKCPYCDFNSHVAEGVDHARWRRAFASEIAYFAERTTGRAVGSIFFGGGTPSLMDPETAAAVVEAVRERWSVTDDLEVTLEANPSSSETARFARLREAGVNRLSIGVQSLDDDVLRFLGRAHSADEARAAVGAAARTFGRFSFDLIYGWSGHTLEHWRRELAGALDLAGEHLSAYQLTIEPGTDFHRKQVAAVNDDLGADLWQATRDVLGEAGLGAYEISNHARPGGVCRHNLAVWRGGDYLGIGPGAHGRISRRGRSCALQQHRLPQRWLSAVEARRHGTARQQPLSARERAEELVIMGLRLSDGLDRALFRALVECEPEQVVDADALAHLTELELLVADDRGMRLTEAGLLCLDSVLRELLANAAGPATGDAGTEDPQPTTLEAAAPGSFPTRFPHLRGKDR